jgi:hypothetical protein
MALKKTDTASQRMLRAVHDIRLVFDLSKPCNIKNHDLLLDKLNSYGMRSE